MTNNTIHTKTIAAAASFAILASAAQAASFVNPASNGAGELFVGVHATGGIGNGKSVVIDLGAVSALSALSTGSTLSLGSIGTDLVAQFGSTWYNRTDLLWSAVAGVQSSVPVTSADPTSTLYGSVSATGLFPLSTTAYNRGTNSAQNAVAANIINNMAGNLGGFSASGNTGAASNIAVEAASDANSYAAWMPNGGPNADFFGGFGSPIGQQFEQAFAPGTLASGFEGALDVYQMYRSNITQPDAAIPTGTGAGAYEFTLTINQSGAIAASVLPVAVPEPASIGMLTSLALFGVGTMRRKRGVKA